MAGYTNIFWSKFLQYCTCGYYLFKTFLRDLVSVYGCVAMLCGAYVECVICGHVCAHVLQ